MKKRSFVAGEAKRKAKDAREKTSGLVNIGLINEDRTISAAGHELLSITEKGQFRQNDYFNIEKDSYIYFKQLLKTSIKVGSETVRPYLVLAKALIHLDYITFDEFTYILPLAINNSTMNHIIKRIEDYRNKELLIEDIIYEELILRDNYRIALDYFINNYLTKELVCKIGMNRKSRNYDKTYYYLLNELINVFYHKREGSITDLYYVAKKINQKPGTLWRKLIFKNNQENFIKKNGFKAINENNVFNNVGSMTEFKRIFFKYMHVFKAMATLEDYFDLNRRYLNITDTLIFEDRLVRFDIIPKYFFGECINDIYEDAFIENKYLKESVPLEKISPYLKFKKEEIYSRLSEDLGVDIKTSEHATAFVKKERYERFNQLIDNKFSDEDLIELLTCFETRNDRKIEEFVTNEASIPTIFEYIVGIIWYKISERRGDILEYMQLSLEANLLPKTHAAGGSADIIYEYEACRHYPKHSLLIEATLLDGTNQRRSEMEPVSRHLGEYRSRTGSSEDYTLFVSTFLHKNVVADFKGRKFLTYYGDGGAMIDGMKIVPIKTEELKEIIRKKINYAYLYVAFDDSHNTNLKDPLEWRENLSRVATKTPDDNL